MRVINARRTERKDSDRSAEEVVRITAKPNTILIATELSTISGKQSWSSAVISMIQSRCLSRRCTSESCTAFEPYDEIAATFLVIMPKMFQT